MSTVRFQSLRGRASALPPAAKWWLRRAGDAAHGRWPSAVADWRLSRTSTAPETFNEKVRYRMAYDRRPLLTLMADKVAARGFVADRLGEEFLTRSYGAYRTSAEIPWATLPREYACKASHGSGAIVLVWDGADAAAHLPASARFVGWERFVVRPEQAPAERLAPLVDRWMSVGFEHAPGSLPEWAYRDVVPQVLVEELLLDVDGRLPFDHKFFVFDGVCRFVSVVEHRFSEPTLTVYGIDGEPWPVQYAFARPAVPTPLTPRLPDLIAAAEELGRGMDFVRVDLYEVAGRIVFGELTNYPNAGSQPFTPSHFDRQFGSYWTLPARHQLAR